MQKQRNNKGQFVKRQNFIQDEVSLTNDFKGLEINQDKSVKYANVVKTYLISIAVMALIFVGLVIAHHYGWIELTDNGGF